MSNLLKKEKKGFTLIEVVLVLAIAGLIMVIVLLAVSGAQKSRRDTQRKNDLSRIASQLENYASNNNGQYPADASAWTSFTTSTYITTSNLKVPGKNDPYTYVGTFSETPPTDTVTYEPSGRSYRVCMGLEQGGAVCRTAE